MMQHYALEIKTFILSVLDSYTAAALFIIFGVSTDAMEFTHKALMILAGVLIVFKGTYSLIDKHKNSKIERKIKETELKIQQAKLKGYKQ